MSDYVTQAEFDALEARVTALEGGNSTPTPTPPPVTNAVQAKRIAELIELFGVNTFSSMDEHNVWGTWPADYRPESVIAALKYIVGDTGFAFRIREYHRAKYTDMQARWLPLITQAFPGTRVSICVAANGSASDVPTMFDLAVRPDNGICWIEGINEPNTDFGSGEVPIETTVAIQEECWAGRDNITIMGPSIVAGTPHPEGWITGYCGDQLGALNAQMHAGNGHYYPPGSPDVPNTGYSVNEYIGGLWTAYEQHVIHLPEFHPTLYNNEGNKPDQPGWSGARDAYYTLCTLLRCAKNGTQGLWWFALFDWKDPTIDGYMACGLFPKEGAKNPRPVANVLRDLCTLCTDRGDRNGFTPGALDIVVEGLTSEMDYDVYQTSSGKFLVPIWYAAKEVDTGPMVTVYIRFNTRKATVRTYDLMHGTATIASFDHVDSVTLSMPSGVALVEVLP